MLEIINQAAKKYRGVIPADRWREPYMPMDELESEIAAGVTFWGAEQDSALVGVMAIQNVLDAVLIRHAYVLPSRQGRGIGGTLLRQLGAQRSCLLVGTWAAARWAIDFYKHHGFLPVGADETKLLLKIYWAIPQRQSEASVVLRKS
jgi:GNAT superfamily N-acetyltransferase